jgi:P27 family predicted phage terminase small subunit
MAGQGGRKRIPDKIKQIKGTDQKCRRSKAPSVQSASAMTIPPWLVEGAELYFESIVAELETLGLASNTYSGIAAALAIRLHEIEECNEIILREGRTYTSVGATGTELVKGHPAVAQRNEALRHMQSLSSELGFTPTAINRVGAAGQPKEEKKGFGSL